MKLDPVEQLIADIRKTVDLEKHLVLVSFNPNMYGGKLFVEVTSKWDFSKIEFKYSGIEGSTEFKINLLAVEGACGMGYFHSWVMDKSKSNKILPIIEKFAFNFMKFGKLLVMTIDDDKGPAAYPGYKKIGTDIKNPKTGNWMAVWEKNRPEDTKL